MRVFGLLSLLLLNTALSGAAYTWKNVVVPAGGFVSGIEFSPVQNGLVYARTDMGGAYRWDNAASVWVPLTDFLQDWNLYGIESIAPDPKNANIVYAAVGQTYNSSNGYVLASTDQGATWTQNPIGVIVGGNADGRNAGERLAVDPHLTSKLYFGSRNAGLWVSINSAATWAKVASFPVNGDAGYGVSWVLYDPAGTVGTATQTIYVGVEAMASGNSNVYRSTNGGTTWAVVPGGQTNMVTPHADLGSDGNLWVVYDSGGYGPNGITNGKVWKMNTTTLAWTALTLPGPPAGAGGYGGVSVDAQNPQHAVVSTLDWWSGTDKIYRTVNGGTAWTVIGNVQNTWNGGPYATYNNNGALWSRFCGAYDGGSGWQGDIRIDPFNSAHAMYTTGGGIWDSVNINAAGPPAGVLWSFKDAGLEETAILDMTTSVAGGVLFSAMGDIAGMRHNDITQSPALGMYCGPTMSTTDGVDYAQLNPNFVVREGHSLYVATQAGGYSNDNGQTWTPFASNPAGFSTGNGNGQIAANADGTAILWALPGNTPTYSTNNGASWINCTGLPNGSQIASDRANANIFYGVSGTNLYVSTNKGASFAVAATYTGTLAWANRPRPVFGIAGEVWLPTSPGLYRCPHLGLGAVTTTKIAKISQGTASGFGKAASGFTHPALYFVGTVGGVWGFFRCDDGVGTAWTRVNDAAHQFGGPSFCSGDELVYGRIYLGTNGRGILYGDISGATTPTNTPTRTQTYTPTRTASPTLTRTGTGTMTSTPTATPTAALPSATPTRTGTGTYTRTATGTVTLTPALPSATPSVTLTRSPTGSSTGTGTFTRTASPSVTLTPVPPSATPSVTLTRSATTTSTGTGTFTRSPTSSNTPSPTVTLTPNLPTATPSITLTRTGTASSTATTTLTRSPTVTFSATASTSPTSSRTGTLSPTGTMTASSSPTSTATASPSATGTRTVTGTITNTGTITVTVLGSFTHSPTLTLTGTRTPSPSASPTPTATRTSTATGTPTASVSPTGTFTPSPSSSATRTLSASPSSTASYTLSGTPSASPTSTASRTATGTITVTPTTSPTGTITVTVLGTFTPSPSITLSPLASATPTSTGSPSTTATRTGTGTPSTTATVTITSTVTASVTATRTATATPTPTSTLTASVTLTGTPSGTSTVTGTVTPTGSVTVTVLGSFTDSPTPTLSGTGTASPTLTSTQTASATLTATPSASPTRTTTFSATATPTSTLTASATPSLTATSSSTRTITPSSTATLSASPSSTPTANVTVSVSSTFSSTASPTLSATQTPTTSLTSTSTLTTTATPTPSPIPSSATPTPSLSPTPTSPFADGPLEILQVVPLPNPGATRLKILVQGSPDKVRVRIWTVALNLAQTSDYPVTGTGWITVPLAQEWQGRHGLYYITVQAFQESRSTPPSKPVKALLGHW